MSGADFETIIYEEKEGIAYIYLNLPPANIMTSCFYKEIVRVMNDCVLQTKMAGIVVSGIGRHFSSGADINHLVELLKPPKDVPYHTTDGYVIFKECREALRMLSQIEKPTVSVISGLCIGSGFELALATKARICEENAKVGLVESSFDLSPGLRGTIRLSEMIGWHKALELTLCGEMLSAQEAFGLGLVDAVVGRKEGFQYAREYLYHQF